MEYIYIKEKNQYLEYPVLGDESLQEYDLIHENLPAYGRGHLKDGREILVITGDSVCLRRKRITMISEAEGDIRIQGLGAKILYEGDWITVSAAAGQGEPQIYCNGQPLCFLEGRIKRRVENGDVYLIQDTRLSFADDTILLNRTPGTEIADLLEQPPKEQPFEHFPEYRRSPRIIKRVEDKTILISKPPEKSELGKGSLVQVILPPLGMLCVTIAVSLLMKRGMFVLMSAATTLMTTVFSVSRFFADRRECRENNEKREKVYDEYLLQKRQEIYQAWVEEKEALTYNYPSLLQLADMLEDYSPRIYERADHDGDFLTVSIGTVREAPALRIQLDNPELVLEADPLVQEAEQMKNEFSYMAGRPVAVDLKEAHLGIVGDRATVHEQLKILVMQLSFMHSYHELQFIAVYDAKYRDEFRWMNWLPHFRIEAVNTFGSVYSERVRDQVIGSMNQILKERRTKLEESKKESRFRPHYIFIIDEPKLMMDHSIMEYLGKNGYDLGFSVIYTSYLRANLPENIGTVLMLPNSEQGSLLLNQGVMTDKAVTLDRIGTLNLEKMTRDLSVLRHELGVISRIPDSITFFEMYQVEHPWQLDISRRWKTSNSHKSLAVPLGVRAVEDYVYLNLHEKAHGPHGLVAGTTGSGKSEIVQSYILSLAVNFHPYEVGFLLIDYKGGGMAGLFKNLPHLLGVITNLDGSESMRAMASIKSELARRQRLFNEHEVNHINGYNQLFKNGTAKEPMPHLFLISDEFAELKKEQPEFMTELVSAARIGRSLGVHLILATQKPSGVVDDQIWTNSKFKLALKVQNEADSREIIKTGDAANITQAGRAYLQVGNNEIYELFQSAWSGADYSESKAEKQTDNRVYLINEIGQGELLNQDLGGTVENSQLKQSQLDATVNYIKEVYDSMEAVPVKRPWLPSLKTQIAAPCLISPSRQSCMNLKLALGVIDIPEEQRQCPYELDLAKDGNLIYVASSGFGKSVLLQTMLLSLAARNAVSALNFYVLDFGNSALISLRGLPHTSDYITLDDEELMQKFEEHILNEVSRRKKLLAAQMVQNFEVYNRVSGEPLKAIVIAVDNFDAVKDLGMEEENFYTTLSRDGASLGIFLLIAASRSGAVKMATMNNFKNKVAGYTFDNSEVMSMVGRTSYKQSEIKGRVLVKYDGRVSMTQLYCPVEFIDDVEYADRLKEKITEIKNLYPDERAPRIPVLPETFTVDMMRDYEKTAADIYVGLHKKSIQLYGFKRSMTPFVIVGDTAKGKTNALQVILYQIPEDKKVYLFDSRAMELYAYKGKGGIRYIDTPELLETWIAEMNTVIEERKAEFKAVMEKNPGKLPKDIYQDMEPVYCVVDDIDDFAEFTKAKSVETGILLREAAAVGISLIITGHTAKMKGIDDTMRFVKTATDGLVLSSQGMGGIFPLGISSRDQPQFMDGCLFHNGTYERLRVPKYEQV